MITYDTAKGTSMKMIRRKYTAHSSREKIAWSGDRIEPQGSRRRMHMLRSTILRWLRLPRISYFLKRAGVNRLLQPSGAGEHNQVGGQSIQPTRTTPFRNCPKSTTVTGRRRVGTTLNPASCCRNGSSLRSATIVSLLFETYQELQPK